MARIRYLKFGFFENEELSSLSAYHRLCFAGLWLLADREGRIEDRPKRIHAKLFPYEPSLDMNALLHDLAVSNFITRYVVGENRVIQVVNFSEHQRPRHDEQASELPAQPLDALGRPLSADATGLMNTSSQDYEHQPPTPETATEQSRMNTSPENCEQQPLVTPMNTNTVEHEHQQRLTGTATERSRDSDKSPLGIGIGIGIGIGTGGPREPVPWQTTPLIPKGAHRNHAFCGKVCFPAPLLEQFTARLAHLSEPEAYAYVSRFFDDWNARYVTGDRAAIIIGEDGFDFWRERWKETHPPAAKNTRKSGKFLDAVDGEITIVRPGKAAAS